MRRVIIIAIVLMLFLTGCEKQLTENKPDVTEKAPVKEETHEINEDIRGFFEDYVDTNERPIAVMVDNDDKNARPQAGLEEAYLIYEIVVEGGATRFLALFKDEDTEKIGPVRSSRHYFLDYALENDAVYTHFGWSPKAMNDISALGVENINGLTGGDGKVFKQDKTYTSGWHTTYTDIEKIKKRAVEKKYDITTKQESSFKYATEYYTPSQAEKAERVALNYSGRYRTGYEYDDKNEVYEKTIMGSKHKMQSGDVLKFKNIIVMLIDDIDLGDGSARRDINTVGSGDGYYITNGMYVPITWTKSSRDANTVYETEDGSELKLNPGNTIVNIIDPDKDVQFE